MTKEAGMQSSTTAVTSSSSSTSSASSQQPPAAVATALSSSSSSSKNKLLLFDVAFAGGRSAFRCGEKMSGWVTVESRGPVHATAFKVECLGFSEVPEQPTAVPGGQKRSQSRCHLSLTENLLPVSRLVEKRSFEFQLPRSLPHSVEAGDLGYVRYCCRAVAVFSTPAADGGPSAPTDAIEATCYFTVIEEVDLNSPVVAQRCTFEEVSCTSSDRLISKLLKDEVKTSLMLKKDAYVPGENVNCSLSVHSSSSVPVQRIALRLVQRTTAFSSTARHLGTRNVVVAQELAASDSQESGRYWSAKHKLHIPGVVATSLANANFQHPIVVEYAIQMCVTLGFAHVPIKDLTISCPILIGTVPKVDKAEQLCSLEASFVEASNCAIPNGQDQRRERRASKGSGGGFFASFHSKRGNNTSGYRCPQQQYTLYCVYYPTISIYRQKKSSGLKSILKVKHSSVDNLDGKDKRRAAAASSRSADMMKRSTSMGWYETQL